MNAEAPLRSQSEIVLARQLVRKLAQQVGFSLVDQTKIVTATSELARNCFIYGGGGVMQYEILDAGARRGLRSHRSATPMASCAPRAPAT